ncbi:hypothetical protein OSTOST_08719 [Ostertagia ostertagi]
MPLRVVPSRLEISSQLQLAVDKVAVCWKAEESMAQFKIALATLDGNSLSTDTTDKRRDPNTSSPCTVYGYTPSANEEPLTTTLSLSVEGISSNSLVVGSSRGSVWLLSLDYNDTVIYTSPTVIRQSDEVEHPATQIEYDLMQNAIYVVLYDKGIARCTLENPSCFLLPNSDSLNPIRTVAVDSING